MAPVDCVFRILTGVPSAAYFKKNERTSSAMNLRRGRSYMAARATSKAGVTGTIGLTLKTLRIVAVEFHTVMKLYGSSPFQLVCQIFEPRSLVRSQKLYCSTFSFHMSSPAKLLVPFHLRFL